MYTHEIYQEEDAEDDSMLKAILKQVTPAAQLTYIKLAKGWDPEQISGVTLVLEGSRREAALQRREVRHPR